MGKWVSGNSNQTFKKSSEVEDVWESQKVKWIRKKVWLKFSPFYIPKKFKGFDKNPATEALEKDTERKMHWHFHILTWAMSSCNHGSQTLNKRKKHPFVHITCIWNLLSSITLPLSSINYSIYTIQVLNEVDQLPREVWAGRIFFPLLAICPSLPQFCFFFSVLIIVIITDACLFPIHYLRGNHFSPISRKFPLFFLGFSF